MLIQTFKVFKGLECMQIQMHKYVLATSIQSKRNYDFPFMCKCPGVDFNTLASTFEFCTIHNNSSKGINPKPVLWSSFRQEVIDRTLYKLWQFGVQEPWNKN